MDSGKRRLLGAALIGGIVVAGFFIGFLIGWFAKPASSETSTDEPEALMSADFKRDFLINEISNERIGQNLRRMTRVPHLAGTAESKAMAQDLIEQWNTFGFETKLLEYDVLLSYPGNGTGNWNQAFIYENGDETFASAEQELILDEDQRDPRVRPPYNAYTKGAHVNSSKLIYANYGRREDFDILTSMSPPMNFTDSIVIMRYGKVYRGNKVAFAQEHGAKGVILYSDPNDYAADGKDTPEETFPHSWWLPPTGVQRGSSKLGDGDPLTRHYPANAYTYKESVEKVRDMGILPKIPSQPIGYADAEKFLRILGDAFPQQSLPSTSWAGGLENVAYRIGGELPGDIVIGIKNNNVEKLSPAYNAIGVLKGTVEPDRYVIIGNHRDAWVFGAVDPTTGTATMLEISRAFYNLYQTGWRPRRSLLFCSWGAEEFGKIGSTEWVEEYTELLKQRSVVYLNVDIAVTYNYVFDVHGSAMIHDHIRDITKLVPEPNTSYSSLYDGWNDKSGAEIGGLGSGSDYAPFFATAGVTAIDVDYTYDSKRWSISGYPLYHSVYETYDLVANFTDPGFHCHQAVGRFLALMLQSIADADVIPFNSNTMADELVKMHSDFMRVNGKKLQDNDIGDKLPFFSQSIMSFRDSSRDFMDRIKIVDTSKPYALRMINDQLMYLERYLLDPLGLPGRPHYKNMIFAPSSENSYGAAGFAGVTDTIAIAERTEGVTAKKEAWKQVDRELSKVIHILESVGAALSEVNMFRRM